MSKCRVYDLPGIRLMNTNKVKTLLNEKLTKTIKEGFDTRKYIGNFRFGKGSTLITLYKMYFIEIILVVLFQFTIVNTGIFNIIFSKSVAVALGLGGYIILIELYFVYYIIYIFKHNLERDILERLKKS